jgi:hypothetical protein
MLPLFFSFFGPPSEPRNPLTKTTRMTDHGASHQPTTSSNGGELGEETANTIPAGGRRGEGRWGDVVLPAPWDSGWWRREHGGRAEGRRRAQPKSAAKTMDAMQEICSRNLKRIQRLLCVPTKDSQKQQHPRCNGGVVREGADRKAAKRQCDLQRRRRRAGGQPFRPLWLGRGMNRGVC